jgi:hypothetical protein
VRILEPGELGRAVLHDVIDGAFVVLEDHPPALQVLDHGVDIGNPESGHGMLGLGRLGSVIDL